MARRPASVCFIWLGFAGVDMPAAFASVFAGSFFLGRGVEGIEKSPWMPVVFAKNFRTFRRGTFVCFEGGDDEAVPILEEARDTFLCCLAEFDAETAAETVAEDLEL